MNAFGRFLRLMVQQAITENARNIEDTPEKPVLFILDEMPALGRLTMVEQAYGLMAGFGIQLWGITQDLCQLRKVYGEDYESFIGNSGAVAYFGSPDKTSAEYFSDTQSLTRRERRSLETRSKAYPNSRLMRPAQRYRFSRKNTPGDAVQSGRVVERHH